MAPESPSLLTLLGMGVVVAAQLAAATVIGLLLDAVLGTGPILTIVGLAVGLTGAVAYVINAFRRFLPSGGPGGNSPRHHPHDPQHPQDRE